VQASGSRTVDVDRNCIIIPLVSKQIMNKRKYDDAGCSSVIFPYNYFARMSREDVLAIKAYLDRIPAVKNINMPPQTLKNHLACVY